MNTAREQIVPPPLDIHPYPIIPQVTSLPVLNGYQLLLSVLGYVPSRPLHPPETKLEVHVARMKWLVVSGLDLPRFGEASDWGRIV